MYLCAFMEVLCKLCKSCDRLVLVAYLAMNCGCLPNIFSVN